MPVNWKITLNVTDGTENFKYTTTFRAAQNGWPDCPETASDAIDYAADEAKELGLRVHGAEEIQHTPVDLLF